MAIGNGILTTENEEQAWVRARRSEGDKGGFAARAALTMIALQANDSEAQRVSEPAEEPQGPRAANKRGAARLAAVQALYQMDVAGSGLLEITAEYEAFRLGKEVDGALYREADAQWFRAILAGVVENQKTVDPVIRQSLTEDWPLSRLDSTLRAILRAGVYELMKRADVPVAVIVSEYVDIAKAFYDEDEPKLVNAVLDRVARRVRGEGRGKDASMTRRRPPARSAPDGASSSPPRRRSSARPRRSPSRSAGWSGYYLLGPTSRWRPRRSPASTSAWRSARCRPPRSSAAAGQRGGFMIGTVVTALGGAVATLALFQASFWLFAFGLLVIGVGGAFVQQFRFAAADNAPPEFKARAISFVLAGGVITAILGPQIVIFTRELFAPVMFAGCVRRDPVMAAVGAVILSLLRPQALKTSAGEVDAVDGAAACGRSSPSRASSSALICGVGTYRADELRHDRRAAGHGRLRLLAGPGDARHFLACDGDVRAELLHRQAD